MLGSKDFSLCPTEGKTKVFTTVYSRIISFTVYSGRNVVAAVTF